jgi:hypothetical protein
MDDRPETIDERETLLPSIVYGLWSIVGFKGNFPAGDATWGAKKASELAFTPVGQNSAVLNPQNRNLPDRFRQPFRPIEQTRSRPVQTLQARLLARQTFAVLKLRPNMPDACG